jgi:hypothetical protein
VLSVQIRFIFLASASSFFSLYFFPISFSFLLKTVASVDGYVLTRFRRNNFITRKVI